jgi:hypothetical protein
MESLALSLSKPLMILSLLITLAPTSRFMRAGKDQWDHQDLKDHQGKMERTALMEQRVIRVIRVTQGLKDQQVALMISQELCIQQDS